VGEIQRRIPGQVTSYTDVNIQSNRVGHDERRRTIHHIEDMEAKGYIDSKEASSRIDHAAEAETNWELNGLIGDLPGIIDHRNYWQKRDWHKAEYYLPALLGGMVLSICSALIPGIILNSLHHFNTTTGQAVFIPLLIIGVVGFFTTLILTVVKSSK
jgi:hypothetical protein